jgi:BsuBI/PstI restriction endonuclease domain/BsuBI/PstI restriction endonuclease HTH domain
MTAQVADLPAFVAQSVIQSRLEDLFPEFFPDRGKLVNSMCARVVFVFLYGGFLPGSGRDLRPAHIYFFTEEQVQKTSAHERLAWVQASSGRGFRPQGERRYADNTRESIRDDLIRSRLIGLGIVTRRADVPTTSSKPAYGLAADFARLFDPTLHGQALEVAMGRWRSEHLDPAIRSRMRLKQAHLSDSVSDVLIEMPDRTRVRVSAGPSSKILKATVEEFARRHLRQPAVLWLSASDRKVWPQFEQSARAVGLSFSASAELPDLILADLSPATPPRFVFCEIVATDGAVTEARKAALLKLVSESSLPPESVEFLTAFADREAGPFRKNFSQLALNSLVWFQSEPDLLVCLRRLEVPA